MKKFIVIFILLLPSLAFGATVQESTVAYGGILFSNDFAGFAGTIEAADAGTYYGFINGSDKTVSSGITFTDDDVNGDYALINHAGDYRISGSASFSETTPNGETVHCAAFINDTETKVEFQRYLPAGAGAGAAYMSADYISLVVGDKVRVKCKTDGTSKTIEIYHLDLTVERVFTTHTKINDPGTPCHGCL